MGGADDADVPKPGFSVYADGFFDDARQGAIADSQMLCEAAEVPGAAIEQGVQTDGTIAIGVIKPPELVADGNSGAFGGSKRSLGFGFLGIQGGGGEQHQRKHVSFLLLSVEQMSEESSSIRLEICI